jgi:hypothetical protein
MTDETAGYGTRLRDLEAEAFRVGRVLAEHSGQWATVSGSIEQRLGVIERVVFALARAQGIDIAAGD